MGSSSEKRMRNRVRRSYLISTISIALVLFILGAVSYVTLSAVNAAEALRERVVISVELANDLTKEDKKAMVAELRELPEVASVGYTTKDEKINDDEFRRQFEQDIFEILDENPLRDSFELTLTKESVNVDIVAGMLFEIEQMEGVEYISVPPIEIIDSMHSTLSTVIVSLIVFLLVLLIITLLLLNNTIRLAIYAKRYLINTMKLVGATKWYIMRPFLVNALWQGLWGGLIAGVMVIGLVHGAQRVMPVSIEVLNYLEAAIIIAGLVVLGIFITIAFSAAAVNKFVNMKTNKIHLY
ncbi:MAG: permease-like cell division protein FtsX [Alistipes sp.]|nr:permease-like cell division protein FtsX [Alistipes sp.]